MCLPTFKQLLALQARGWPGSLYLAGNRKGRDIVREALRQASEAGLNVLRTFAHTTDDNFPFQVQGPGWQHAEMCLLQVTGVTREPAAAKLTRWIGAAQSSPGEFNENTFRALDWLLDEARLHGLRVVLSFIDNWKYPGKAPLHRLREQSLPAS